MPDPHTNFGYPTIIAYRVMKYWIWSHCRYREQSVCMRRITWPITGSWLTFLKLLTPTYV